MDLAVSEIAARLGAPCEGEGARRIRGLAGLCEAGENDIAFAANPKYAPEVAITRAGAVLVGLKWDRPSSAGALLRVPDPDKAFADVAAWFAPPPVVLPPGVHPTAVIAPGAELGPEASIGPHVVIEPGARIGARSALYAGCYVGHGVSIGNDCRLYPHVSIRERCRIGHRVILHNGVVIGSDGFGYNVDAQGVRTKIPQIGIVEIGDDVEIGANATIDRARFGMTRIGKGAKIDNLVMIAHNVTIGDHAVLVAQVGVSGSAEIGAHAILAGQVGVVGHIKIGDGAIIGAQSGVPNDVPARAFVVGSPPVSRVEFARNIVNVSHIPKLKERIAALEKQVRSLETRPTPPATGP